MIGWWINFHNQKVPINSIPRDVFLDLPNKNSGPKTKDKEAP